MLKKLKPKSEFSRNVLTLMTGTTIAQAIPIAISPILTRIYTPEDFGMFALYMSVASILSVVATGRYELAIMLPKKDEDAVNIVALSILISFFVSFMALLIVFIFNAQITNLLGNPEISSWLYFIPITVLLTGIYQSFNYWSNRKKQYKRLAMSRVIQSGTTATTNLGIGFGGVGGSGLILGGVFGQGVATAILGRLVIQKDIKVFQKVKRLKMFALARRYVKFPKFDIPSSLIYAVYSNMAIIFFTKFFEASVSGFYFFANRILRTPFSFFISAFSDVFYQKLSKTKDYKEIANEINQFSLKIFKITFLPFLFIVYSSYFYVEPIFGEKWRELYLYIDIFALPIYIGLLLAPYGHVLKIINRQEISMYLHLFRLTILGVFFISYFYIDYPLVWFLYFYAMIDTLIHIFLASSVDLIIKNREIKSINFRRVVLLIAIGFINLMIILQG
jgi:O-antigen/teichoic acid export membrane protein